MSNNQSSKNRMLLLALALFSPIFQLAAAGGIAQSGQRTSVVFRNSIRFLFDTDGNQVDAYGSKIDCKNVPP
jgi:hypothetical protein